MTDVILVGAGGFGRCWWDALQRHPRTRVVGIVEPDDEAASAALDFFRPSGAVHLREADPWKSLAPDWVLDCSPFPNRERHSARAFEADAHLLAAKPLAATLEAGRSIVAHARRASRRVVVAQQMRYFPCFQHVRHLLQQGRIGKVQHCSVTMRLDGRGWVPGMAWRLAMDNPLLLEAGIHHYDLLRHVLSADLVMESTHAWRPAWSPFVGRSEVSAMLRTEGGVPVDYRGSFSPAADEAPVRFDSGWRIVGESATITVVDGGVYVDGEPDGPERSPEPVPLEVLNEALLNDLWAEQPTETALALEGESNVRSLALVQQSIDDVSAQDGR